MGLGDELIQLAKGREIDNNELSHLYDLSKLKKQEIPLIQKISYKTKPSPIKGKYYTFQFDKGWGQRTWSPENQWSVRQLHGLYHHYKQEYNMINIGERRYDLKTIADIITGSVGHVGICSGMGWLALACGIKPEIFYTTNSKCSYLDNWKRWWKLNGVQIKYFDEEFKKVPCNIAVDGKKYEKK